MATGLTDAAGKVFGKEEIDRILSLPITQMRIELKHAYQDKEFTQEQFEAFVDRLAKVDNLGGQVAIAKQAAEKREVGDAIDIELNSPAKQLLWAAVMTRMMRSDEKAKVSNSTLWKQMQDTVGFNNEAIGVSKVIARSLQNADTTFDWGAPGTWFYYHPKKNHINIDMYYTLLMGFEHVRAVHLHEIGHSELSNTYSPTMKKLYDKVKVLIDPSTANPDAENPNKKKPRIKMKKAEYRQLMLDVAEWQLRFKLWHMTEDTVVNQFSANKSGEINQNFGNSLNYVSAVLQGFGELMSGDAFKRDVKVSTDAPPDANDPKRAAWEEKQQKKEAAAAERAERLRRATTPLTDDEVKEIQGGKISKEIASKMFDQINTAVLLAYYEQNGMFRGVDKNWERLHIIPQDIRRAIDVSNIPGADGKDAFEYLIDMSVGQVNPNKELMRIPLDRQRAITHMAEQVQVKKATSSFLDLNSAFDDMDAGVDKTEAENAADYARELLAKLKITNLPPDADPVESVLFLAAKAHGIRNLQPQAADRILQHEPYNTLQDSYRAVVGYTSEQRGMVMEHVWDTYLKPYADVILKAYEEKLDKKAEQKKQQQKDQKQDQNQQGQKGQKGQQGGQGQSSDGDGEGSSSGGADSEPDISDNQEEGEGQDSGIEITDDENDGESNDGDPSDDNEKDGDGQDSDKEDGKGGAGDDDEVELDDEDMSQIGEMNEKPEDGREQEAAENEANANDNAKDGKDQNGQDQDGQEQKSQPKKVSDFKNKEPAREDLTEQEKQERRDAAKNMPQGNKLDKNTAQDSPDVDLAKLAKGDYRDFNRRVYELAPVISQQARIYQNIRAEQRRAIRKMSRDQHSFIASDGNFLGRHDMEKSRRTKLKQAFGQPVNVEDFKKIKRDEAAFADSTIEIISLIDGSGSMPQKNLGNGVNAMEVALQSAVINYMAARKAGIDGWIIIWGNNKPLVVASPDMPLKEVGENVQRVRGGINSGTALAPAFDTTMQTLAEHRNKNGTISGSSHIMVYSDGEIQDEAAAQQRIEAITQGTKNVSIDVAVLVSKGSREAPTEMERMMNKITAKTGDRKVGVLRGDDARTVPLELARRTLQRVKRFKVEVVPDDRKRAVYKAVSRKLDEMARK